LCGAQLCRPTLPSIAATIQSVEQAEVAQLVEQLIRNQQVVGSSPTFGSRFRGKRHISEEENAERAPIQVQRAAEQPMEISCSAALCIFSLPVNTPKGAFD
jgi:hypothetical protein